MLGVAGAGGLGGPGPRLHLLCRTAERRGGPRSGWQEEVQAEAEKKPLCSFTGPSRGPAFSYVLGLE